ncbi:hypothetical protein POVCU2_0066170 [Plasmodium ovale curtisi]|uniref:PIR Superfamily Protein n=1 Tax=Plasmodium ovale curtisi TaxID=864141 RepID=A0A1A8WGJ6_PLAOA|nr:hypothetical protein POVCU2_0066170 [Plasmodium ovale curtisi]
MTSNIYMEDIPSKKYNNRLEKELHYEQPEKDPPPSYELIEQYIYNSSKDNLNIYSIDCIRVSKLGEHNDDIENMRKIVDFSEDIAYIIEKFSEIHSNDCNEIESYINQKIYNLKIIYTTSETKYSNILGYYSFTSFNDFYSTTEKLKSTCQEGATRALLTGDQSAMPQYSGRNTSTIATTFFGSILNNLVGKKIKFGNNLSDEAYHEILEDIFESSHDGGYNILYNSIGDS